MYNSRSTYSSSDVYICSGGICTEMLYCREAIQKCKPTILCYKLNPYIATWLWAVPHVSRLQSQIGKAATVFTWSKSSDPMCTPMTPTPLLWLMQPFQRDTKKWNVFRWGLNQFQCLLEWKFYTVCPLKHIWDAVSAFKFFVILLDNYTEEVLDNEVLSSPAPSNNAHTNRCI